MPLTEPCSRPSFLYISENLVAMADPDEKRAGRTFQQFPNLPRYTDFRKMLDKEAKNIDAVTVSCPDHMHASAAMWARVSSPGPRRDIAFWTAMNTSSSDTLRGRGDIGFDSS